MTRPAHRRKLKIQRSVTRRVPDLGSACASRAVAASSACLVEAEAKAGGGARRPRCKHISVALRTTKRLQQAALAKVAEISTSGAFDHVDGEFEQANFPCVVHALNHSAEWFVCAFHTAPGPVDDSVN
jgi:hypothetical protein